MGADLLLNFVWANKDKEPDWKGARSFIESMPAEDLMKHPEYEYHMWFSTSEDEAAVELETVNSLRKHLLDCHDTILTAWFGDCDRSTFKVNIGIYEVLVTGGTSWGDSPSDMFNYIQDWGNIEGLPKFGFYPS